MATKIVASFVTPPFNYNNNVAVVPLGTRVNLDDGGVAIFCQAASDVSQYAAVAIGVGYTAVNATTTAITQDTGTGRQLGWVQTSIASSNYCWVQVSGRPVAMLAANCADRVQLFTTATAGVLDDATVSTAEVLGVVAKTSISNATAVTLMVPSAAYVANFAQQA